MTASAYQSYRDQEVLTSEPIRLVCMLYEGAIDAVASARRHLHAGDIRSRAAAISKAIAIVNELALSVDHTKGGEVGKNLVELYDYIQRHLLRANAEQVEAPMAEVESLLKTMLDGWRNCVADSPADTIGAYAADPESYQPISYSY